MGKKRSRIEVVHSMLAAVQEKGGSIKPTHLMYKANLSHSSLQRHVDTLEKKGLLVAEEAKGGRRYRLTEKGYSFLAEYQRLRVLADTFGL